MYNTETMKEIKISNLEFESARDMYILGVRGRTGKGNNVVIIF